MRHLLDDLLGDARHAVRSLRRSPWFTAITLTTLIVGIGSVTAIFCFVYSFYWRPLPYKDADRILAVSEVRQDRSCCYQYVSTDLSARIVADARSFERVALWDESEAYADLGGQAQSLAVLFADTSFARMFDLHAQLGRLPSPEEIEANAPVVAIGDALWRSAFGADTDVLHQRLHIGTETLAIVGVLPPNFGFPRQTDVLRPLPRAAPTAPGDEPASTGFLGKLRPGITRQAAAAELALIATRVSTDASLRVGRTKLVVRPEMLDRRATSALPMPSLFIGSALFLLLIACTNVANLMLVRAAERRGEMAVRASLGASRLRLVRHALTESLLVAVVAGVGGALLSLAILRGALAIIPTGHFPVWLRFGLDGRVLAFTLVVVLAVSVAVGLMPALDGTRFDLARALKVGGDGGVVNTRVAASARRGLSLQLALSVALFIGSALFVQSYRRLSKVDYGYPAEQTLDVMTLFDNARSTNTSRNRQIGIPVSCRTVTARAR